MDPAFRSLVYYGPGRQASLSELENCNVVITTYNVVSSEWKQRKRPKKEDNFDVFSFKWHRIVLDEGELPCFRSMGSRYTECIPAHMIRGSLTQNARAVRDIDAIHRWCITGTPLQNRVSDISSLLMFLRVYPYDNRKTFEADIIHPWKKEGINEKPLQRLRMLVKMISLYRSKKIIDLPSREEITNEVDFNAKELSVYEDAREGTVRLLDQSLSSGSASGSTYLYAFQKINELRYICNHGANRRKKSMGCAAGQDTVLDNTNEHELDHLLDNADEACLTCGTDISEEHESAAYAGSRVEVQDEQLRLCTQCVQKQHLIAPLQLLTPPSSQSDTLQLEDPVEELPSKIQGVISYVSDIPTGDKWYALVPQLHENYRF